MQIFAIVVSLALTVGALALLVPAVQRMLGVIRNSQPAPGRTDNPVGRGLQRRVRSVWVHGWKRKRNHSSAGSHSAS